MMLIEGLSATGFVDLLIKLKISPKQLLLLMFLYHDRLENNGLLPFDGPAIANVYRYAERVEGWTAQEVQDLVDKGLMIDNNSLKDGKKQSYPDHFHVTQKFIDAIYVTVDEFEEFWETYPSWMDNFEDSRKAQIPLKSAVYETVEEMYRKRVKTKTRHRQVMEILRWAIDNDMIKMGIEKYVGSSMFDQQKKLMEEGITGYQGHKVI
jgi:hypothetical protein